MTMEKSGLLFPGEGSRSQLLSEKQIEFEFDVEAHPFARGKFAAVRRAVHRHDKSVFAAKYIRKRRRTSPEEVWHEVSVLDISRECHFIVRLFKVFETPLDTVLLLEMAEGGDLQTVLDTEEYLDEVTCVEILKDTLRGLNFLHQHSIAHLDIKPQNLVLTCALPVGRVKLCDFGVSRHLSGCEVRELLGTPDYVSPEVLNYEPLTLATDCWAVGVLTYVLLSGVSPFGGDCKQETFLNISQRTLTFPETYFQSVSSLAVDFVEKFLVIKPNERLTADGGLRHIWLDESEQCQSMISRPHEPNNNHKEHNNSDKTANADGEQSNGGHHQDCPNSRSSIRSENRGSRTTGELDAGILCKNNVDHSSVVFHSSDMCITGFTTDALPTARRINTICN